MPVVGWDVETRGTNPWRDDFRMVCSSYYVDKSTRGSIALEHPGKKDDHAYYKRLLRQSEYLEDPDTVLVGHGLVYDYTAWMGWLSDAATIRARPFDTMIAHMLVDENVEKNSLEAVAQKYLGEGKLDVDARKVYDLPLSDVLAYNLQDARLSKLLYRPLLKDMRTEGVLGVFEFMMDLFWVIVRLQLRGIKLDVPWAERQCVELEEELSQLRQSLAGHLKHPIDMDATKAEFIKYGRLNLNANEQVAHVLYQELGWPIIATTDKTGKPRVDKNTLKELKELVHGDRNKDTIDLLLDHSQLRKILRTYIRPYLESHRGTDGRVHGRYHITRGYDRGRGFGTVTGRLASSEPNLTNVANDKRVKGCFIPSVGMHMCEADYSQVELRVAGWLSGDSTMQDAFARGRDLHCATLAAVEGVDYDFVVRQVKEEVPAWVRKRKAIKTFNFSMLYGAGLTKMRDIIKLQAGVDMHMHEVKRYRDGWFKAHREFRNWQLAVHSMIEQEGRVRAENGMVRRLFNPGTVHSEFEMYGFQRQGLNFLIQNFAAFVCQVALVLLDKQLASDLGGVLLYTVHDSAGFEYPRKTGKKRVEHWTNEVMVDNVKDYIDRRFGVEDLDSLHLAVDVEAGKKRWG